MYLVIILIATAIVMIQTGFFLLFLFPSYLLAAAVNYYFITKIKPMKPGVKEIMLPSLKTSAVFVLGASLELMFVLSDKENSLSLFWVAYLFGYSLLVFGVVNSIYFWQKRGKAND